MTNLPVVEHWRINVDDHHIAWLELNHASESVNVLSKSVMFELSQIIKWLECERCIIEGVIFFSGKDKGFIAGADVHEFVKIVTEDEALSLLMEGQALFDRIEQLPMPTVAMIHGFCLGGGCELALACTYRVASDHSSTKIGLPEVMLGIHPGWGGSVRLPRLVGLLNSMAMILSGRSWSSVQAKKKGLVNEVVPFRHLRRVAINHVINKPEALKLSWWLSCLHNPLLRPWIASRLRKQLKNNFNINSSHYPAPYVVIDNWLKFGVGSRAMDQEAVAVAKLIITSTSRHLVRAFFHQEAMKSSDDIDITPAKQIHVIGAGVMGGDIASWCALKGMRVTLYDMNESMLAAALVRAHKLFNKRCRYDREGLQRAKDRLTIDVRGVGAAGADIVIEAVVEDLAVKQAIFKELEATIKPGAILATNTSSIPLEEIATVLRYPERLIGIHFFNPVAKMQLVEVIHQGNPDSDDCHCAQAFVRSIARLPLLVKSSPGFLVNRVLMPYLLESMKLLEEGVSAHIIDRAACEFGMPMGPIALADTVGLDICQAVCVSFAEHFGYKIPKVLKTKVKKGYLGRKTGRGFYRYKKGNACVPRFGRGKYSQDIIEQRLVLRLLNEASACMREGIVLSTDNIDAGLLFGIGFAPFRGGIIEYANQLGMIHLMQVSDDLVSKFGDRFVLDEGLSALVG